MSSWSGTNKQTRATFGCSIHPDYVDRDAFQTIKMVATMLPGIAVTVLEPAAVYTVPQSQVARPIIDGATYSIISEMDGSHVNACVTYPTALPPHTYELVVSPEKRSIQGVTIRHEELEQGFSLIPEANYSDVKLYNMRTTVQHTGWDLNWIFHFREVFYYPVQSDIESFLFFTKEAKYEIEVITEGWVGEEMMLSVIEQNLPHIYMPDTASRYKPTFVLTNPNN